MPDPTAAKRSAALAALDLIESGMTLGLGTGSTAALAIEELGARVRAGLDVRGVPTSFASERLARAHGVPLTTLDADPTLDLAFDGADAFDERTLALIKGRGAAMTREKIVAAAARRFVVLVDAGKRSAWLGEGVPVPVEIVPMAAAPVARAIRALGGAPQLRMGERKDGPVVTDQGLWIVDARWSEAFDPAEVNRALLHTPGVLDHGLFLGLATDLLIGESDGSVTHLRAKN
jgi:ribose 5-phosphate isomerase A